MGKNKKNKEKKVKSELQSLPDWAKTLELEIASLPKTRIIGVIDNTVRKYLNNEEEKEIDTPIGKITTKKGSSQTDGAGRLSWWKNGEKFPKTAIAKMFREGAPAPDEETTEKLGPPPKMLESSFKKKLVVKTAKAVFGKKVSKKLKAIEEKVIIGSDIIAAIDDAIGEEAPLEKITDFFEGLK